MGPMQSSVTKPMYNNSVTAQGMSALRKEDCLVSSHETLGGRQWWSSGLLRTGGMWQPLREHQVLGGHGSQGSSSLSWDGVPKASTLIQPPQADLGAGIWQVK